jgi:hypothetical protein
MFWISDRMQIGYSAASIRIPFSAAFAGLSAPT